MNTQHHERTTDAAKGQWRGILMSLGVPGKSLANRHGPCPMCEGQDRFRFDNQEGSGSYICNQCGAGRGMDLAMRFTGRPFVEVASEIDSLLGNKKFDQDEVKPAMTDAERLSALRGVAALTTKLEPGSIGDVYFATRGLSERVYPRSLRFAASLRDGEGGVRPAIVATIQDAEGKNVTLHRTFLMPDGSAKARMAAPRKLMPGCIPDGSAVRLSDWNGGALGIAEGIETAMSASRLYDMPVWAAINATMLEKWTPPEGCDEVTVFADNDANFTGQAAAYRLANKLAIKGMNTAVLIPDRIGTDWNDALLLARPVNGSAS